MIRIAPDWSTPRTAPSANGAPRSGGDGFRSLVNKIDTAQPKAQKSHDQETSVGDIAAQDTAQSVHDDAGSRLPENIESFADAEVDSVEKEETRFIDTADENTAAKYWSDPFSSLPAMQIRQGGSDHVSENLPAHTAVPDVQSANIGGKAAGSHLPNPIESARGGSVIGGSWQVDTSVEYPPSAPKSLINGPDTVDGPSVDDGSLARAPDLVPPVSPESLKQHGVTHGARLPTGSRAASDAMVAGIPTSSLSPFPQSRTDQTLEPPTRHAHAHQAGFANPASSIDQVTASNLIANAANPTSQASAATYLQPGGKQVESTQTASSQTLLSDRIGVTMSASPMLSERAVAYGPSNSSVDGRHAPLPDQTAYFRDLGTEVPRHRATQGAEARSVAHADKSVPLSNLTPMVQGLAASTGLEGAIPASAVVGSAEPDSTAFGTFAQGPEVNRLSAGDSSIVRPSATTAPPPGHQIAQAVDTIRTQAGGSVELSLSPEELGTVRITMNRSELGYQITIVAERHETLVLLKRHADQLDAAFRNLDLGQPDISFGQERAQYQPRGDREPVHQEPALVSDQAVINAKRQVTDMSSGQRLDLKL